MNNDTHTQELNQSVNQNKVTTSISSVVDTVTENVTKNVTNNKQFLFESKEDLIKALIKYRSSIFGNVTINEVLIMHLTKFFILQHPHFSRTTSAEKLKFVEETYFMFEDNFSQNAVDIASDEPIGKGTYSKVFLAENYNDVVKVIRIRGDESFLLSLKDDSAQEFWQYILDFFTYILWITVFKCLKEKIRTNDDNEPGDLINNICEIKRPFIVVKQKETKFVVGYIIKKYEKSLAQLHTQNTLTKDVVTEVVIMLYHLHSLGRYGVTLLHRDVSFGNIMMSGDSVKLIDFGFGLTVVKFPNGTDWRFGYFFDELYDVVVEGHYDVIFFCLYMLNYYTSAVIKMGLYHKFRRIIAFNDNIKLIDLAKPNSMWLYPYKAAKINKSTFMREFVGSFIQIESSDKQK